MKKIYFLNLLLLLFSFNIYSQKGGFDFGYRSGFHQIDILKYTFTPSDGRDSATFTNMSGYKYNTRNLMVGAHFVFPNVYYDLTVGVPFQKTDKNGIRSKIFDYNMKLAMGPCFGEVFSVLFGLQYGKRQFEYFVPSDTIYGIELSEPILRAKVKHDLYFSYFGGNTPGVNLTFLLFFSEDIFFRSSFMLNQFVFKGIPNNKTWANLKYHGRAHEQEFSLNFYHPDIEDLGFKITYSHQKMMAYCYDDRSISFDERIPTFVPDNTSNSHYLTFSFFTGLSFLFD